MFHNRCYQKIRLGGLYRYYSKKVEKREWQSVVGLEVHAQISSKSKLFSRSSTDFNSPVNTNVSLFDCSTPGTLPVLNRRCVEAGVLTALALNCRVNPVSMFDRKHYFYADIPAGYQITQQRAPLANDGYLTFQVYTPGIHKSSYKTKARIKQVQLEQDSGKSLHDDDRSLVDLNRAGIPLMEVVFEPDLVDGEEAAALVKELLVILQRIGTCSGKMEEGALRVDANVSVNRKGESFGTRTEIKNIGSVRGVAGAIKSEIERQIKLLEEGGTVVNETRAWDAMSKSTWAMRDKEQQQDYRYMPEPNLPPLHLSMGPIEKGCVSVDALRASLPELPEETRNKLHQDFGLTMEQAIILVNEDTLLNIFQETQKLKRVNPKLVANILINDFLTLLNKEKLDLNDVQLNSQYFEEAIHLLESENINRNTFKLLLKQVIFKNPKTPTELMMENDWQQISNREELHKICEAVLSENPKVVEQYKKGKTKVFKALLGVVVNKSNNRANMSKVDKILKELLEK